MIKVGFSVVAGIVIIIMAFTWMEICIARKEFVTLSDDFLAIGKYMMAALAGGAAGFQFKK